MKNDDNINLKVGVQKHQPFFSIDGYLLKIFKVNNIQFLAYVFCFSILSFSCKKNYKCSCQVKDGIYSNTIVTSGNANEKMTKKQAKSTCKTTENTLTERYNQNSCSTCTSTISCTLK